ncbi:pyridoxal phosphate-dependent aminotransferase [Ileibacterium valens]|uniref:Aminotransferase n=3 Tax=Ileibacterium valens TaxID=1862668 RepID=A0A1U7NEW2_9FIRM|nr:aminotransferase class I/II-fold pyridoxal phosphate-dependent enzyme [Ileibacterium valens]OLU37339.1 aromatic amino acid aminotransferase [Erysipelotrichaceae bacterium NYU-BL-E8]OLU38434.1 aromatic amino acid aminotransferase [Ileibacterium valens]OLU43532.1 aromatic amino acid aminotransferase [Erysipelotrichaceae bacterium NYU-BL-F16]
MIKKPSQAVIDIKPSGIRKFFDLASSMKGVISLGVGEPDFDTPWHVTEAGVDSLANGQTHYTANRGLLRLRQEISKFHDEHYGTKYDPDKEIIVTVGGSEAVDLCCRTLLEPGDEVIVLDPNYVAYEPAILLQHAKPVFIELKEETEFKLLPEDLEKAITDKTKAIILNYPSNPTGGVMTREDYEKLVPIIKKSGIYVISDEIYAELTFDGEFASLAQFDEVKDQVIVINGFSKAFAMTGWRLGYTLSSREISSLMLKIHQFVIMSAPTPAQHAAIEALKNGYPDVLEMKKSYEQRRNLLVSRLNKMGLKTNMPHGTFYVFANIKPSRLSSDDFCTQLLEQEKVAIVPGTAFGVHGEGFVRISYATSLDNIKKACEKIEHFLETLDNQRKEELEAEVLEVMEEIISI